MKSNVSICPVCGGKTRVTDRRDYSGVVRRRRRCLMPWCGHRYSTVEIPADFFDTLARAGLAVDEALGAVQRAATVLAPVVMPKSGDEQPG